MPRSGGLSPLQVHIVYTYRYYLVDPVFAATFFGQRVEQRTRDSGRLPVIFFTRYIYIGTNELSSANNNDYAISKFAFRLPKLIIARLLLCFDLLFFGEDPYFVIVVETTFARTETCGH